jgi:hypothetical protein
LPQHADRDREVEEDNDGDNEGPLHADNIAQAAMTVEQPADCGSATLARGESRVSGAVFSAGADE